MESTGSIARAAAAKAAAAKAAEVAAAQAAAAQAPWFSAAVSTAFPGEVVVEPWENDGKTLGKWEQKHLKNDGTW